MRAFILTRTKEVENMMVLAVHSAKRRKLHMDNTIRGTDKRWKRTRNDKSRETCRTKERDPIRERERKKINKKRERYRIRSNKVQWKTTRDLSCLCIATIFKEIVLLSLVQVWRCEGKEQDSLSNEVRIHQQTSPTWISTLTRSMNANTMKKRNYQDIFSTEIFVINFPLPLFFLYFFISFLSPPLEPQHSKKLRSSSSDSDKQDNLKQVLGLAPGGEKTTKVSPW